MEAIIELSMFFDILGTKELRMKDLEQIEAQIPITLRKLEKQFPPVFSDVMVHLPIHLAHEAKIGGPLQFRHKYTTEQTMYTYKSYICNRAQPEGSITEGYLADECMTLCSRYLQNIEMKFNRLHRNCANQNENDGGLSIFNHPDWGLGAQIVCTNIDKHELDEAHIYLLKSYDEVQPSIE